MPYPMKNADCHENKKNAFTHQATIIIRGNREEIQDIRQTLEATH